MTQSQDFPRWANRYGGVFEHNQQGTFIHLCAHAAYRRFEADLELIGKEFEGRGIAGVDVQFDFANRTGRNSHTPTVDDVDMIVIEIGTVIELVQVFVAFARTSKIYHKLQLIIQ